MAGTGPAGTLVGQAPPGHGWDWLRQDMAWTGLVGTQLDQARRDMAGIGPAGTWLGHAPPASLSFFILMEIDQRCGNGSG